MTIKIKAKRRTINKLGDSILVRIPEGLKAALAKKADAENVRGSDLTRGALCDLVGWEQQDKDPK